MSLRLKIALMLAGAIVPIVLLFSGFRYVAIRDGIRDRIASRMTTRHVRRAERKCRRNPERFHDQWHRVEVFAYDENFKPTNSKAPDFPGPLRAELTSSKGPVTSWEIDLDGKAGATAVRAGGNGSNCSVFLFVWRQGFGPSIGRVVQRTAVQAVGAAVVLLVVGLLVAGPLVRRIRRLTEGVRDLDDGAFRIDVETDASDELGELARAFNRAGDEIRETVEALGARDEALRQYVANTTHDLAVPVSVLQHRLSRISRQFENGEISPDVLHSAIEETEYIASMLSNLGVVARMDAGDSPVERHEIDLREIVERVGTRFEQLAEQKQLDFNWAVPAKRVACRADSTLVEQAIGNCVQNAIQYNTRGGHVAMVLDQPGSREFEIQIVDDGPGVPEDVLDRLTERSFRHDDARGRRPSGQGFGLSIAKQIIEAHDWHIDFANRDGDGLEVTIAPKNGSSPASGDA